MRRKRCLLLSVFILQLCLFLMSLDYDLVTSIGGSVVGASHRVVTETQRTMVHLHALLYTQATRHSATIHGSLLESIVRLESEGRIHDYEDFNQTPDTLTNLPYLPDYKNPCWYEHVDEGASDEGTTRLVCLPYFLVAGFAKCGTTELFHLLKEHPQIVPADRKEMDYWSRFWDKDAEVRTLREYASYFHEASRRILTRVKVSHDTWYHPLVTYDSSPTTFYDTPKNWWPYLHTLGAGAEVPDQLTPDILRQILPNAKLIVVLRNPTKRLYSDYNYFDKDSADDFHKLVVKAILEYESCREKHSVRNCAYAQQTREPVHLTVPLTMGMYSVYVEDWLRVFPRKQLYFLKFEDFVRNRPKYLRQIFRFLDLDAVEVNTSLVNTSNSRQYKIGPMLNETRWILDGFYRPHNERLARLLNDFRYLW